MKDDLGNRMKENYENRTRMYLPRRTNTIIRLDGKAFHTFTKNFEKPFDNNLIEIMNKTTLALCENIQGAVMGYVQSDEISLLLQDFDKLTTDAWYDGNIQKIVSVSASMATGYFNKYLREEFYPDNLGIAFFDSRVFTVAEKEEVMNYFLWRQKDATRNSISMVAQSLYSHKELEGKSSSQMQELCFQKGVNWNNLDAGKKRGRFIIKDQYIKPISDEEGLRRKVVNKEDDNLVWSLGEGYGVKTHKWAIKNAIDFQKNRETFSLYLDYKMNFGTIDKELV